MKKGAFLFSIFAILAIFCGNIIFSVNLNLTKVGNFSVSSAENSFESFQAQFAELIKDDDFETIKIENDESVSDLLKKLEESRGNNEKEVSTFSSTEMIKYPLISELDMQKFCEKYELCYSETENGFEVYSYYINKRIIAYGYIKNSFGAEKVLTHKDYNILSYRTESETKNAYEQLKNDKNLIIMLDLKFSAMDLETSSITYNYASHKNHWGTQAIDLGYYNDYLATNNSNKEVVVAVLDTGIRTTHKDFSNRLLKDAGGQVVGFSAIGSFDNDVDGHGTHVSGTIVDMTPNNVKILPMKVLGDDGSGSWSNVTTALAAITDNPTYSKYNVVAANMSLGNHDRMSDQALQTNKNAFTTAFNKLRSKNILPIVAAGNEQDDTYYHIPAACENAITVSAVEGPNATWREGNTLYYNVAASQEYNGSYVFDDDYSNYGSAVDIAAPGSVIQAAINTNNTGYCWKTGTSMAAPHVAAAVALLCADARYYNGETPTFTASQIESRLLDCTVDLGSAGKDIYYGHGLLNLKNFNGNIAHTVSNRTVTYNGNYHNISVTVTGVASYQVYYGFTAADCSITDITTDVRFKNYTAGAKTIYFKIVASGHADTYGSGTLTINKANVGIKTENQSFVYGNTVSLNQSKYTKTSGTIYGADDLSLTLSTTANNTSAVGEYDISATSANTNYNVSVTKGKCVITQRPISISLSDQTSVYGNNVVLDKTKYVVTSALKIVNGDDLNLTLSTNANNTSPIGEYNITFVSANSNYVVTATNGKLRITPRVIKLSMSQSSYYGDNVVLDEAKCQITSGSIVNNDNLQLSISTTATKTSSVGSYPITITSSNANYSLNTASCIYTIYRRSIVVKPDEQQFEYGTNINLSQTAYTIQDIVNNDPIQVVLSTTANNASAIGSYDINSSYVSDAVTSNYNITCQKGTLKIVPRKITITAQNQSSIYGDNISLDQNLWVVLSGSIINDDEIKVTLTTSASKSSRVGNYDIQMNVSGNDVSKYDITKNAGILRINARPIKIQLENQEAIFGKEIVLGNLYQVVSENKVVNGDNLNITLTTTATVGSPIGEYEISLTYDNDNYLVEVVKGILFIRGREVQIFIEPQTFVYGNEIVLDQTKVTSAEDLARLGIVLATTANNLSEVGTYDITASSTDENVKLSYVKGVLTIMPRTLNIEIQKQECEYGNVLIAQDKLNVGATVNGDVVDIVLLTGATNASSVGNYSIYASTTNKNYVLDFENAELKIVPKALTISLLPQTNEYGSIQIEQTKYRLSQQPINGDNLNIRLTTNATNSTPVGQGKIDFEFSNPNYVITGGSGVLTIAPRTIEININQYSTYGEVIILDGSNYSVVNGSVINGDDLKLNLSTTASQTSPVGIYEIFVVCPNDNYTVNIQSANLIIQPKDITIKADNQTSIYGDDVKLDEDAFTILNDQIINGDVVNVELFTAATSSSPVDDYQIQIRCFGPDEDNYTIQLLSGVLTIEKRQITIKIINQQGVYGNEPDVKNLYEVVSENKIVNGDELNIRIVTTATQTSVVGDYPLTLTYNNSNYEVSYIEGIFSVLEGDMIVTILPQTFVYGEEINLDHLAFTTSTEIDKKVLGITLKTNATSMSDVGSGYEIDVDSCINPNYDIVVIKGVLTIVQKDILLTLENQTRVYGEETLNQTKFKLSEDVVAGISLTTKADRFSPASSMFEISFDWSNKNYNIILTNAAKLTILQRSLIVKTIQTCVYGNNVNLDNSLFDVVSGEIVNGDDLQLAFTTTAKKFDDVGNYQIGVICLNTNYVVSLDVNSLFSITQRPIEILINQNKYYGDDIVLRTDDYQVVSGSVVNNDSLNLILSTSATKNSVVGEYDIQVLSGNSNYSISLKSGKLNVAKRLLFIEAIKTGEYGNYFALNNTYTIVEGSLAFESDELNIVFSTDATMLSSVGNYDLIMTYNNDNYDVELKPTSCFVVVPRVLTIKIGNQSSVYGESVVINQNNYQILSGSIVNNDNLNVSLSTSAQPSSSVGKYVISGNYTNMNYYVNFMKGEYEIQKRKITIKLQNQKIARGITFEINQKAYEVVSGDILDGDELNLEIYSKAKMFSMMGNYKLMAKYDNENYDIEIINGKLFLNISFIDIGIMLIVVGVIALIVVKVVKKRKEKNDNQKLFDKWIKW